MLADSVEGIHKKMIVSMMTIKRVYILSVLIIGTSCNKKREATEPTLVGNSVIDSIAITTIDSTKIKQEKLDERAKLILDYKGAIIGGEDVDRNKELFLEVFPSDYQSFIELYYSANIRVEEYEGGGKRGRFNGTALHAPLDTTGSVHKATSHLLFLADTTYFNVKTVALVFFDICKGGLVGADQMSANYIVFRDHFLKNCNLYHELFDEKTDEEIQGYFYYLVDAYTKEKKFFRNDFLEKSGCINKSKYDSLLNRAFEISIKEVH